MIGINSCTAVWHKETFFLQLNSANTEEGGSRIVKQLTRKSYYYTGPALFYWKMHKSCADTAPPNRISTFQV
jgi:hypothetical protein